MVGGIVVVAMTTTIEVAMKMVVATMVV